MNTYNTPLYQTLDLNDRLAPVSKAAGTTSLGGAAGVGIDMGLYGRILFVVDIGVVTTATVDFKLQAAPTSGGTFVDVAGFAITQVATSDHVVYVEIDSEQLAAAETTAGTSVLNKYRFLKGLLTVTGGGTALVSAYVYAAHGRFKPEYLKRTLSDGTTVILSGTTAKVDQVISPKASSATLPPAG